MASTLRPRMALGTLEAQKNTMTIKTPKGTLIVPIAPAAVDRMRTGDEVVLRLGLTAVHRYWRVAGALATRLPGMGGARRESR